MPTVSPIQARLDALHERFRSDDSGAVATYIPELAKADPTQFGLALATLDGHVYESGDSTALFTIQSISKPFVYGLALQDHGTTEVLRRVGVEPSGDAFNSVVFDERGNRPFNPMVNAGAIATAALIKGSSLSERLGRVLELFGRLAGREITIDESVYASEKATGHRNRAIAYLELNAGMLEEPVDDHLDLYFKQCSILVSARDLAVMAATLANDGVNPLTGARALERAHVRSVLSVMQSCGMYDFSGEWGFRVGLPAKSGVGGGILAVLPGQVGVGTFSPPLDDRGNSVRGVRACAELSEGFQLHMFGSGLRLDAVVRRQYTLREVRSKHSRSPFEDEWLDLHGDAVRVVEAHGPLGVAAIERIARVVTPMAGRARFVLIDGRRVMGLDPAAAAVLTDLSAVLAIAGTGLVLTNFGAPERAALAEAGCVRTAESVDAALEACEDSLLAAVDRAGPNLDALEQMEIFQGLSPVGLAALARVIDVVDFGRGEDIVRQGEAADALYAIARGGAVVTVPSGQPGKVHRIGAIGPGVGFGELALFDAGTRTATVTASEPVSCYRLGLEGVGELRARHPDVYETLLQNVGRSLARRLRRANAEIEALTA
ncbi:MAG: glutaminase A [Dehalococcoidia bacterium]